MARIEQVHRGNPSLPAIVFVHGLGGNLFDTWVGPGASRDNCWLHWVGQDTDCDTWTLEYDGELSRWKNQAMPLPSQATQVASLLAVHSGLADRDIVLVGHSMGGLVIKTLVTQTQASGNARVRALLARIRGIAFVATPHQGSQLASLATAASALLRTNAQVGNMSLHDAHLGQLGTAFRAHHQDLKFKVIAFAEGHDVEWKTKRFGVFTRQVSVRVVDSSSSDPGLVDVITVPLGEDHFSICKPSSRDAQIHRELVTFVQKDIVTHLPVAAQPQIVAVVGSMETQVAPATPPAQRQLGRLTASDSRLSPAEGRLYGRENEVEQVLSFLRGQGNGVIVTAHEVSGVGGIGKTEVCKAALQRWLAERPDQIVWFVPVTDGANLAGLVHRLASTVELPDMQTAEQLLHALPPGLYYLDNLESVASSNEGAAFLRAMQQLPGIRLLVSSRYSLPSVFGARIEIGVLPKDAALLLFRELWLGQDSLPTDELIADFIVVDLGCHALSVTLAARLGDCYAYHDLVQRWRAVGAAILQQHGETGRHGSLSASLRLTAEALNQTPGAVNLWTVFALFATGVSDALLDELEQRSGCAAARPALVRHHVIKRQVDGRWTMLPPLARYALGASLIQTDGFDWTAARPPVRAIFSEQASAADSVQSTADSLVARAWLLAHFESLARLLRHEMQASPPDVSWLENLHHRLVNLYQFRAALAADLLHQLSVSLMQPVSVVKLLGDLEGRLGRPDAARALLDKALAQYELARDELGQANTLKTLGNLESQLGRVTEARTLYDRALALYECQQAGLGQAYTLQALGNLERRLGRVDEARALYDQALAQFERGHDGLGQANTLHALGDLERRLGRTDEASALYDRALTLYELEQDNLGRANTLHALGSLENRMGRVDEARALYIRALALHEGEQNGLGQANTLKALGDLEHQMDKMDEARTLYNRALAQFEQEQAVLGQANTLRALGELERRLGRVDEARALFDKALVLYERQQVGLGQANTLQALGDLARAGGDPAGASLIYQRALTLYLQEQDPIGLAYTFAELARCFHTMLREAERDESLVKALNFASRTRAESVIRYVRVHLDEMMGGPEGTRTWLLRQSMQDEPPAA